MTITKYQKVFHNSQAFTPEQIIDTLGASDTFNAGLNRSLVNNTELQFALTYACRLAGYKYGQVGFNDLSQTFES